MPSTRLRRLRRLTVPATLLVALALVIPLAPAAAADPTYRNPLTVLDGTRRVESCADPTVARDPASSTWYMACTTDPLSGDDRDAGGNLVFHLLPMFRSTDLITWTYLGDAFAARPSWVASDAGLWAPELIRDPGAPAAARWRLYFAASGTTYPGGGSAIGVATAPSPEGPWSETSVVVEPHAPSCCPGAYRWVFDPEVLLGAGGKDYLYYGSYFGGLSVRELSADGRSTDPATQVDVAIANRYEAPEVIRRGGWYYLLASATNCCNGPLTGYSVFAGRSTSPTGPFVDRHGRSLLAGQVGGTPVLSMGANRWVGPGHNTTFQDMAGQWWTIYHAVDSTDPYFAGAVGFTKRPALLDALDWVDGWPVVRGGAYVSDSSQPAPAAQPGTTTAYRTKVLAQDRPGSQLWADDFAGSSLSPAWSWVREPAAGSTGVGGGVFRFDTQAADLYVDSNNASVLTRPMPTGPLLVEAKVRVNLPAEGCCFNYVQGGLVLYASDDRFLKLATVSIWETRQTEWAKEVDSVPASYPRYGNSVVGPPGTDWTWLRITVRPRTDGPDEFTAWTSPDGATWDRGGTWLHELGPGARIGIVSMGGSGFTTEVDYVRVSRLKG